MWNFRVQLGVLGIQVKIEAAARGEGVPLRMVAADGGPVTQKLVDSSGAEVDRKACGRGIEVDGVLSAIPENDLAGLTKRSDKVLELSEFVPEDSVDPVFLESSYYVKPDDEKAEQGYTLLFKVLKERKVVGIGRCTLSGREHYVMLRAGRTGLMMYKAFYREEIRGEREFRPDLSKVDEKQLKLAHLLVEMQTSPAFDPSKWVDEHTAGLKRLVAAARVKASGVAADAAAETLAPIDDLMELIQQSVDQTRQRKGMTVAVKASAAAETTPAHVGLLDQVIADMAGAA